MTLSVAAKNTMLNALAIDALSLHSGFPGLTGANEISGGIPAYARVAPTFLSSSGGVRTLSGSVSFDVGAGTTVRWAGSWAAGVYQGCAPNGGTPREFTVDPATDVFTSPGHGFADAQKAVVWNGTMPTGLTEATVYYFRDCTTDTFKLAATAGGAAINITGSGSTDNLVSLIVEETYGSQGTHTFNSGNVGMPL